MLSRAGVRALYAFDFHLDLSTLGHTKPLLMLIAHMFHIDLGTPGSLTVTLLTGAHMLSHIKHELQLISGLTPTQLK
jgi:hypothetical protein